MMALRCVFDGLQGKHASRLHESPIELPAAHIGLSKRFSGAQRMQPGEAKSELPWGPQFNFHVFSWSAEKTPLFTFWPPRESPGGAQEKFFGPQGACTALSGGGPKGDPLSAKLSSRVGETHVFENRKKSKNSYKES